MLTTAAKISPTEVLVSPRVKCSTAGAPFHRSLSLSAGIMA